jgi:hypothetical protein
MAIRRRSACRSAGPLGTDPCMCTYDAIFIAWTATAGTHPPESGRTLGPSLAPRPFFTGRDGGPWDTEDTRLLERRCATALGLDPSEFGGKSSSTPTPESPSRPNAASRPATTRAPSPSLLTRPNGRPALIYRTHERYATEDVRYINSTASTQRNSLSLSLLTYCEVRETRPADENG